MDDSYTVDKLRPISFNYKHSGVESTGFTAQELEPIFPFMVSEKEDGMKTVNYNSLIGILVKEVKN